MNGMKALRRVILAFSISIPLLARGLSAGVATNDVQINSLTVDGYQKPLNHGKSVSLGSFPQEIAFGFEPGTNAPFRIRYRLEGYENNWHTGGGAWMYLAIRFYNESGDQISQTTLRVAGDSAGWNG